MSGDPPPLDPLVSGTPPLPTELPRWIGAPPPPEAPVPVLGWVQPGEVEGGVAGGAGCAAPPEDSTIDSAELEPVVPSAADAAGGDQAANASAATRIESRAKQQ